MYIRQLQDVLLRMSQKWSVISVTGPRQSGKTTLCQMAFPDYDYVNLEHLPTRMHIQEDIDAFLDEHQHGLIIDEAQYMPDIFSYIQVRVDRDKRLRYVLSGSSDFLLMQGITQSLAGRVAVLRLLPLSFREIGAQIEDYTTNQLMFRGFYPAVWGDEREPKDVYESYYETYLVRDVRQIINVQNINAFRHFVMLCAGRVGSEFNAMAISQEVGVSNQTITNWMSILETSYTAFRLQPFYRNIGKRLSKTPKIYFYDVGLAAWLLGIRNETDLQSHPLRGSLFENMVVVEMLKQCYNKSERPDLYFYRDKSQHEVDVLRVDGLQLHGYEIKSGATYLPDWQRNLTYLRGLMPEALASATVVYDGAEEQMAAQNRLINYRHVVI